MTIYVHCFISLTCFWLLCCPAGSPCCFGASCGPLHPYHMVVDRHGYHPSPGVKVWPGIHGCTRYLTPELSGHQRQPGKENGRDGKRLLPLRAVVLIPSLPVSPTLCDTTDLPLEDTLVVKVLDKNPSCPCCGNQTGWILGLTEHLKS